MMLPYSRMGRAALAVVAGACGLIGPAHAAEAGDSIFSQVAPPMRDRLFMRLGYVHVDIKTTSGQAYDVTGNVVNKGDLIDYASQSPELNPGGLACGTVGLSAFVRNICSNGATLDRALDNAGLTGLGAPEGIRARSATTAGTPAISVGYHFSDDYAWTVEAYVLAKPITQKIYGDGLNVTGAPNGINGKHIITTDLLPPTFLFGRYFGGREARFKPFLGLAAQYAIFFDTKATSTLNDFQGGANPGDTTVSIKNTFGFGPSVGVQYAINDDWHVSLNIAKVRLKTDATLTTRNTTITSESAVLADYPQDVLDAIASAQSLPVGFQPFITRTMQALVAGRNRELGTNDTSLGTFVRKQETKLDNTMFMLSIGRTF